MQYCYIESRVQTRLAQHKFITNKSGALFGPARVVTVVLLLLLLLVLFLLIGAAVVVVVAAKNIMQFLKLFRLSLLQHSASLSRLQTQAV